MLDDAFHVSIFYSRYPRSDLVDAVCLNDLLTLKELLDEKEHEPSGSAVPALVTREEFHRAYYHAIRLNRIAMVPLFLKGGASAQRFSQRFYHGYVPKIPQTSEPQTPLIMAALSHDMDLLRVLFAHGASVGIEEESSNSAHNGFCLLSHLATKYHPRVVDTMRVLIVELGADINPVSGCDRGTPLHRASGNGKLQVVQLLVHNGADINARNHFGETPLMLATTRPDHQPQTFDNDIMPFLLQQGAAVGMQEKSGKTALHHACSCIGSVERARLLLQSGSHPNAQDHEGSTPLHLAMGSRDANDLGPLLLRFHANPNTAGNCRNSPLHVAVRNKARLPAVLVLLEHGSNTQVINKLGFTPLETACHQGQLDMVYVLFQRMVGLGQIDSIVVQLGYS